MHSLSVISKAVRLKKYATLWNTNPYFGFVQGHAHLTDRNLTDLKGLVGKIDNEIVTSFEKKYAEVVGPGQAISYATGRMGFYALMDTLSIGRGDEVILQGATCSVMVNAVLRIGARPVFADFDPDTFGSSAEAIEKAVTNRTRMIVAQHSFGIPCRIEPIVKLAKSKDIFLLEDCALTLARVS